MQLGTFTPDNLLAGDFPRVTQAVTVASGNVLLRGTVLGRITASGKCAAVDSTQEDGSESPFAVLVDDVDATSEDKPGLAYLTGEFNEESLIFGGTDTADDHRDGCRALSIFLKQPVKA